VGGDEEVAHFGGRSALADEGDVGAEGGGRRADEEEEGEEETVQHF